MNARLMNICWASAVALLATACAVSPEAEERRQAIDTSIAEILSQPIDTDTYGEAKRCLSNMDFRSFRALNNQFIVFTGRGDKQWINKLRNRCIDLDYGDVLITRSFISNRICDGDSFEVTDWFSWPWYRRWPWYWGRGFGTGMSCTLGTFQPVTDEQIGEIEAVLEDR